MRLHKLRINVGVGVEIASIPIWIRNREAPKREVYLEKGEGRRERGMPPPSPREKKRKQSAWMGCVLDVI